jgi:mono/diheme cytochrome c family protein
MTKRMMLVGVVGLIATITACAGNDENPAPTRERTPETTKSGLSTSFGNQCARCHGQDGKGTIQYPPLPGARDEAGFIALVRQGKAGTDMPGFTIEMISDADLKADFLWMTTKR